MGATGALGSLEYSGEIKVRVVLVPTLVAVNLPTFPFVIIAASPTAPDPECPVVSVKFPNRIRCSLLPFASTKYHLSITSAVPPEVLPFARSIVTESPRAKSA